MRKNPASWKSFRVSSGNWPACAAFRARSRRIGTNSRARWLRRWRIRSWLSIFIVLLCSPHPPGRACNGAGVAPLHWHSNNAQSGGHPSNGPCGFGTTVTWGTSERGVLVGRPPSPAGWLPQGLASYTKSVNNHQPCGSQPAGDGAGTFNIEMA
ncbi:hypothetical protein D3C78_1343840 [compost metagenome]